MVGFMNHEERFDRTNINISKLSIQDVLRAPLTEKQQNKAHPHMRPKRSRGECSLKRKKSEEQRKESLKKRKMP